ncbi:MAG TPA: hypothetical protein VNT75_30775 [Symbiobacteriaceae bacterium]|nr:hypothetical protein [Symbiobacteriaceae bacterium]
MTNQITEHYQGMSFGFARPDVPQATSDTQEQLAEMRSGERWSLTATERVYNAGGIENGTMSEGSPQA